MVKIHFRNIDWDAIMQLRAFDHLLSKDQRREVRRMILAGNVEEGQRKLREILLMGGSNAYGRDRE